MRSNDSDVIIAIACVQDLNLDELWIAYGLGTLRYIPAHMIARQLGPEKSRALLAFHAITGCDTVSSIYYKGKRTAWDLWQSFPEMTTAFQHLSTFPQSIEDFGTMSMIEEFVARLYGSSLDVKTVNESRMHLFYNKAKDFVNMPPTKDALIQHSLRAAYQAGHVWGQALITCPDLPDPSSWGWYKNGNSWDPVWTTLPPISKNLREHVSVRKPANHLANVVLLMLSAVPCVVVKEIALEIQHRLIINAFLDNMSFVFYEFMKCIC